MIWHPAEVIKFRWTQNSPNHNGVEIFTDASKETDQVGVAFVAYKDGFLINTQKLLKLSSNSTVFQAEAIALRQAILWGKDYIKNSHSSGNLKLKAFSKH
ncbi:hypothetical protein X975_13372, partial [Stegodyphus mimosarum]